MITSRSPRPPQPAGPRCAPRSHRSLRCLRRPGGIEAVSPFESTRHRNSTSRLPSRLVRRSRCSRLTRPSHGARWRATRRRPPASARHAHSRGLGYKPVQISSWWNERARPGRGEAESLSRHYPNEVRVSCSATASGPRAFGAVGGVVALSACAGGAWAFGSRYCRCGAGSVYP
jgi:hypothetical protein